MTDTRIIYTGEPSPNDDLIGKRYIDTHDSGDQVMEVWIIDALSPASVVWVHPVGEGPQLTWWRDASLLRPLIAAFEASEERRA